MPPGTLKKGIGTVNSNVSELMKGIRSPARKKAVLTLMKKHNITMQEAMFKQALAISRFQAQQ